MDPITTPSISEYVEWLKDYRRRFVSPRKNIPIIPKLPDDHPRPHPDEPWAICGECGMELRGVMGYVCPNSRCPVFPHVYCQPLQ